MYESMSKKKTDKASRIGIRIKVESESESALKHLDKDDTIADWAEDGPAKSQLFKIEL